MPSCSEPGRAHWAVPRSHEAVHTPCPTLCTPKPTLGAVLEVGCRTGGGHLTHQVPEVTCSCRSPSWAPHMLVLSCQPWNSLVTSQPGLHWSPVTAPVTALSFTPVITICKPAHGAPLLPPEGAQRDFLGTQDPPEHPGADHHPTRQRAAGLFSTSLSLHCLGGTNGLGAGESQETHCSRVEPTGLQGMCPSVSWGVQPCPGTGHWG